MAERGEIGPRHPRGSEWYGHEEDFQHRGSFALIYFFVSLEHEHHIKMTLTRGLNWQPDTPTHRHSAQSDISIQASQLPVTTSPLDFLRPWFHTVGLYVVYWGTPPPPPRLNLPPWQMPKNRLPGVKFRSSQNCSMLIFHHK